MPLTPGFRSRSLRLVVGLAVALAIPVGALLVVQFRSLQDLERTSAAVLQTLGAQVADSLRQSLTGRFEAPSFEIERIDHLAIERVDLAHVGAALRERTRALSLVDAFYLASIREKGAGDAFEMVTHGAGGAVAFPRFEPAGPEAALLVTRAEELAGHRVPWGMSTETIDGRPQALVLHLLFDSSARQRVTSFIGFRVDMGRFTSQELPHVLGPLVAEARRRTSLATLEADLMDQRQEPVYRSDPVHSLQVIEQRQLPVVFFSPGIMPGQDLCRGCQTEWTLRVGYEEGTAQTIAHASTSGHRTLLAVLGGLMTLGVALAVRTALTEMRLAEAKSHFVASVSHDLKTPLALIQLFAETLDLGRVRSAQRAREYYAIINREAKKLGTLIDNVLDFSRIESGLRMYRLQPVELGQITRRIVTGFGPQFEHEGFEVSLTVDEHLPRVAADEDAVSLAIGNLITNAMKYSGTSRRLEIAVGHVPRGVMLRVQDHGIGIHRRHQRRIFRKFYRVDDGGADSPRGCGLGLAIVDQVMRAHHGRVVVDSEPGRGSTFTLVFPAAEREDGEADPGHRRRTPDAAGAA